MNTKKYKKYKVEKAKFPTKQVDGSGNAKGSLIVGHKAARQWCEEFYKVPLRDAKLLKNRYYWVFAFPIGQEPKKNK